MEGVEIRIYDADFNWVDVARMPESVQFCRDIYGAGQFEIHIHPDKPGAASLCGRGNIIMIDGRPDVSGIVRNFSIAESAEKTEYVIYGETGAGFLKQRLCVPPTNTQAPGSEGFDRCGGDAESVIKHYVERNVTNPFDKNRKIHNFVIAANKNRGAAVQWQARYSELLEELAAIGASTGMGFWVYADIQGKRWIFDVIEGADRTRGQSVLSPVSFNMEYQNVAGYEYTEDYSNFRNTGYIGGKGDAAEREVAVLGDSNAGRDRFETFIDCGGAADTDELNDLGSQKLSEMEAVKNVEASALPRVFIFEEDYFIGDTVSLYLTRLGLEIPAKVTAVNEIWERESGYKTEIRFGERLPNIFSVLQKKDVVK